MNEGPERTAASLGATAPDVVARLRFILEADALKEVLRRSSITNGARRENSAEHSWHLALMAIALAPCSDEPIDVARVVEMVVVHDLVEIDVGDTFIYDDAARAEKEAQERIAAARLFGLLPGGDVLLARWEEFEARVTPEARFARAIDRLQPLLLNHANEGRPWREHEIAADRVTAINSIIDDASHDLWAAARTLIDDAVTRGWLPARGEPTAVEPTAVEPTAVDEVHE
jgi:putative hydrolase of HD superfamily